MYCTNKIREMDLIKKTDLTFGKDGYWARIKASVLYHLLGADGINKLYGNSAAAAPKPFQEAALDELGVTYHLKDRELNHIPHTGPAIIVSNHPTGALDGIILIDLLSKVRPDVKFMGNFLLERIEPLKRYFINVDPFDNKTRSNVSGMRRSMEHLAAGGVLMVFPAGEVATWQKGFRDIKDKEWEPSAVKFIQRAGVPVIPLHIDTANSTLFHLMGKIHPMLRTAMLGRELLNKKGEAIDIRIGSALTPQKAAELTDTGTYGRFLRANVEYMEPLTDRLPRAARRAARKMVSEIADNLHTDELVAELNGIRDTYLLFAQGSYEVYCAPAEKIPSMLHEIGRQREITFRQVGEGTKNDLDTDTFDSYYHQLFIWDTEVRRLVGAYRMGMGDEIMKRYGLKGFYTNTLFHMEEPLGPIMEKSIELGRSFVVSEYQRKPISLKLLWKGILFVLLNNARYRYLLGPVTISGEFRSASKLLISSYIRRNHMDTENSQYIKPMTGIAVKGSIDSSLTESISSMDLINKLVVDIEGGGTGIPVLIRRYLQIGSLALGFNTDHEFSDALDVLILLDLRHVPEEAITMLSKEANVPFRSNCNEESRPQEE